MAFRVQGPREFFLPEVEPLYGLDRADGERRFAIEGIVGFVRDVFGYGTVVQTGFW